MEFSEEVNSDVAFECYQALANTVDGGVFQLNAGGQFVAVDDVVVDITGCTRQDLLGEHVSVVLDDADVERLERTFHSSEHADDPVEPVELTIVSASGNRALHRVQLTRLEADDEFQGIVGLIREIPSSEERAHELERYETIVETVNDGIYTVDPDGRFTMVNEAYAELTGYSTEELLGSHVTLVIGEDVAAAAREHEQELIAGERDSVVLEADIRTADGETTPAEATFAILPVDGGREYERIGVVRDITERKRAEEELRTSEERFRTMMEQSPYSIQIFDANGRTVSANPAWERLWDASRDELADYNVLQDEQLEADGILAEIQRAFAGEVVTLPVTHYDPAEIGKEGRDRWIEGYVYPLVSGDEESFEVAIVHHDVTERKRAEEALRESEERLRLALAVGDLGVWELDLETEESPARSPHHDRIFGYEEPLDDWSFEKFLEHVHPDDRSRVKQSFEEALQSGDWEFECRIVRADDEQRWIAARGEFDTGGDESRRAVGIIRDITDRKHRQQELEHTIAQLERSNAELERFAYAASHDLQEPLRMVSSYLQLLEDRYRDELDSEAIEFIDFAVDGADRMREMVDALLMYTRLDFRGEEFAPVDADDVLTQTMENLQIVIDERDAEIIADPLPTVMGDESQLTQLFQNLLDNALTYVDGDPPRIQITTEEVGDEWQFSVQDNGIGIDPERSGDIFQVFNRLHTRAEYDGTGIGLALCQRIIDRHDGRIWFESEPGDGSTFMFTLPSAGVSPELESSE